MEVNFGKQFFKIAIFFENGSLCMKKPNNQRVLNSKSSSKQLNLTVLTLKERLPNSNHMFLRFTGELQSGFDGWRPSPAQHDEEPPHQSGLIYWVPNKPVQPHRDGRSFFWSSLTVLPFRNVLNMKCTMWTGVNDPQKMICNPHFELQTDVFTFISPKPGV